MEFLNGIFGIHKSHLSLSFSLIIAGLFLNPISASSSTPLVSNTMEYDFGVISQESTVYVTFRVTNVTNKLVEIEQIRSSCGCTLVKSLKQVVAPRETLPLEVSFDPRDKYGSTHEEIRITYKNLSYPDLVLSIRSQISAAIVSVPPEIRFEPISIGKFLKFKTVQIIQLDKQHNKSLEISYSGTTSQYFDTFITKDPSGNVFEKVIRIIPRQNLPTGMVRDILSFKTNHPFMKKIDVPVSIQILGNIKVRPEVLLFGSCQPLKITSKTLTLKSASENVAFHILKVDTDLSQLHIKIELDPTQKNMYRLIAELKPGKKDESIAGTINVYTSDPYQRIIKIPVVANVVH